MVKFKNSLEKGANKSVYHSNVIFSFKVLELLAQQNEYIDSLRTRVGATVTNGYNFIIILNRNLKCLTKKKLSKLTANFMLWATRMF